jgi:indole-3-glycerol phosphate synthase
VTRTGTPTVLERIVADTRRELERRKRQTSLEDLAEGAVTRAAPWAAEHRFRGALMRPGLGLIAEFKRRSPSAGAIREGTSVVEMVSAYERGGAAALSVLTDGPHFAGSLDDLRAARGACDLPILRKDFIVDAYQLHEARAAGADAVLLIVAALELSELQSLHEGATAIGLDVLVEVHDTAELEVALSLDPAVIGINNRDLRDFSVDVGRTFALRDRIPDGIAVVSESGIATSEQLAELERARVSAVLVGESLMRADDPAAALRALLGRGDEVSRF